MKKCVLITGAASGIGLATAREFASHGYDLIITGRREEKLNTIREELINKFKVEVQILSFDVRIQSECAAAVSSIQRPIDILINNAGLAKGLDFIHEGNLEHWEQMIDTNVKGLLYMTRLISPGMVERKSGHIINLCS
ncbi:MAG TPA: SDR family NAD(P)-dependent oxidoreductase, partial [Saprospiraceae bacterium]